MFRIAFFTGSPLKLFPCFDSGGCRVRIFAERRAAASGRCQGKGLVKNNDIWQVLEKGQAAIYVKK
ncbi:MAG: hypothetical protein CSA96_07595 [Bacteroidetes bacterium]|nr:MAG: hypothetical protein CSA96_07595 [Bacteroidota bacterium]